MTQAKSIRRPGRPRGSSRYTDSDPILLAQVADKLLANVGLTTRAAIIQVVGYDDTAGLRRLQVKFKPQREHHMKAALNRKAVADRVDAKRQEELYTRAAIPPLHLNDDYFAIVRALGMPQTNLEAVFRAIKHPIPGLDEINSALRPVRHIEEAIRLMTNLGKVTLPGLP